MNSDFIQTENITAGRFHRKRIAFNRAWFFPKKKAKMRTSDNLPRNSNI
jgi:hypothetical protein